MGSSNKIILVVLCAFVTLAFADTQKLKPSIDLEDYIDKEAPKKGEDLGTSETGYYGPHLYHGYPLAHHGHEHPHHEVHAPYHHDAAPHGHYDHHHGYEHAHVPYGHHHGGHSHSYVAGEYGVLGHVSSAHVSYGTTINHGHPHYHHHGYYR